MSPREPQFAEFVVAKDCRKRGEQLGSDWSQRLLPVAQELGLDQCQCLRARLADVAPTGMTGLVGRKRRGGVEAATFVVARPRLGPEPVR